MNNLSELFYIQRALRKAKYPDYKRISKKIAEFITSRKDLKKILEQIKQGKPWEYICKSVEFYTIQFYINQNVIIPRIETEKMVNLAIKKFKKEHFDTVIDIGTGSGCIIIALVKSLMLPSICKKDLTKTKFIATDSSGRALNVAEENIKKHNLLNIIKIKKTDLIKRINLKNKSVLLMANLPYIPQRQYERLDESIRKYEPKSALEGGVDGNKYYKKLSEQLRTRTFKNFTLILETEESIIEETKKIFNRYNPIIVKDIYDKNRFLIMSS